MSNINMPRRYQSISSETGNAAETRQTERPNKCKCLLRLDDASLSAIERYVDSTWKELSFIERLAIAKRQSPVESCGMTGKFYLPIEKGFKFHPVCSNTFCRLLGCTKREFLQMKRALTDRDWLCPDLMKEIELLPSGVGQRTPSHSLALRRRNVSTTSSERHHGAPGASPSLLR